MMFDVIDISDDDEDDVQFIEHVIKIEKPVVDLTTPQAKKRRRIFEREERPASSTSPATSDSSPSPSSQSSEQSDQSPPSPRPSHSRQQAPPQPQQHFHQQQSHQDQPHTPRFQSPPKYFQQPQPQQRRLFFTHPQPPHTRSEPDRPEARSEYDFLHQQYQQHQNNSQQRRPPSPNPPQPHPRSDHPFMEQTEVRFRNGQQQQQEPTHSQPPAVHKQQPSGQKQPTQDATQPPQAASDHDVMHIKKEEGNKHFRNNEFDVAIRNYKEASELAKKLNDQEMSAILHFNLAMAYDRLGAYNQAADECAAAVRLNDNYIKAHVKRANILLVQAKFDEAVICFEHIIEIDSSKRDDAMRRIASAKELAKKTKRPDQYQVLGLRPNFSLDDLRAAYKQKARAHHPDKHSDADVVTRRIHEKIFKEASEAYSFFRKRFG